MLPVWVTMSFDATGRTFTGCTIPSMARTLEGLGADAIGLNCSQGPKQLLPLFQELCRVTTLPVIAKPNAAAAAARTPTTSARCTMLCTP